MDNTNEESPRGEKPCCAPGRCEGAAKDAFIEKRAAVKQGAQAAGEVREVVREKYGQAVKAVTSGAKASCCGSSAKEHPLGFTDPITRDLYAATDTDSLPAEALLASFGCGNPTALAELRAGEVVLDLGSGGGIDVLLSAKRVGPSGLAYGLDMTDEMLELANQNKARAGATNVVFLKGTIENIPLPKDSVDVIISNCVINLSGDKDAVLREAYRVLRPGGRFAISDIVLRRELPEPARRSMELWTGCIAGALLEGEYQAKLEAAGFHDVGIEPTRIFDADDAKEMAAGVSDASAGCGGAATDEMLRALDGAVMSAFVRATKPPAS
jgi:SAM-dependent methyltransferase